MTRGSLERLITQRSSRRHYGIHRQHPYIAPSYSTHLNSMVLIAALISHTSDSLTHPSYTPSLAESAVEALAGMSRCSVTNMVRGPMQQLETSSSSLILGPRAPHTCCSSQRGDSATQGHASMNAAHAAAPAQLITRQSVDAAATAARTISPMMKNAWVATPALRGCGEGGVRDVGAFRCSRWEVGGAGHAHLTAETGVQTHYHIPPTGHTAHVLTATSCI